MVYSKKDDKDIPMLSIVDDAHGMTHEDILRMISFGHKHPGTDDTNRIGRFGIGYKTGAMRFGKDALVLTQSANTRSIAFLSQSLNEGRAVGNKIIVMSLLSLFVCACNFLL